MSNPLEILLENPEPNQSSFKWATVTSSAPLRIRLDGDDVPIDGMPDTLVDPASLTIGSRVLLLRQKRRTTIIGQGGGDSGGIPTATYIEYGGTDTLDPAIWLPAEGQAVSRTTYARLFGKIGVTYGAGDGSTTFVLPDARGRTLVGLSTDTEFDTLGKKYGTKTHTLTIAEMPSHDHGPLAGTSFFSQKSGNTQGLRDSPTVPVTGNSTTGTRGGGGAHNNIQPSIVARIYIKT